MNLGTPNITFAPEANVIFRESSLPFDTMVKSWLSDNHNYYEVSRNRSSRSAFFKKSSDAGTSPSPALLEAIARKLLICPKCKCQVGTAENYKAKFADRLPAEGRISGAIVSEAVTLICYKCGSETRVADWKAHLGK